MLEAPRMIGAKHHLEHGSHAKPQSSPSRLMELIIRQLLGFSYNNRSQLTLYQELPEV